MPRLAQESHGFPQVLRGEELSIAPLRGRAVAVIGYGNQGRAHALNLRDSGIAVTVGGRVGSKSTDLARGEGFKVGTASQAADNADLVVMAMPDEHHASVWERELAGTLRAGQTVGFLHGFSVHFGLVRPPAGIGCVMVAPKGPGSTLRERFSAGEGIPALLAVHQEATSAVGAAGAAPTSRQLALAWAAGIGCGHAAVVETTFKDEAETDLFGEQAVLCGGMLALAEAGFQTLVDAGYPPLLAYIECVQEIKQVADLLYSRGPAGMRAAISNTAEFGAMDAQPRIADAHLRAQLRAILRDVQGGAFAKRMVEDAATGGAWLNAQRAQAAAHGIEEAGRQARALMPWLGKERAP